MKNWLSFWKFHRPHDLEARLRAARPEAPTDLVKAIAGEVRPQPVRRHKARPLRVGRAVLVAAAAALAIAAVSSAAGLSLTHNIIGTDIVHIGSPTLPSSADQYAVTPTITSISPLHGTIGTTITITGTNFMHGVHNEADSVTINGTPAASFTIVSATEITAVVASGTGGTGHVTVHNTAGTATSSDTFSFAPAVPSNTGQPLITGSINTSAGSPQPVAAVGNHLSVSNGSWSPSADSYTYQWFDDGSPIDGATGSDYTLASSDLGHVVTAQVTAHNAAGASAPNASPAGDPRGNVGAPNYTGTDASIPGTPQVGTASTAHEGTWTAQGSFTFVYQWSLCGPSLPSECSPIDGATHQSYTPVSGDNGHFLSLHISGTNSYGSNGWDANVFTSAAVIGTSVDSFSPGSGLPGQVVTLTGHNFTGATAVKFNGTDAGSFVVNNDSKITAVLPSGATTGPISVTTSLGTGTSATSFVVLGAPVVSGFAPSSGGVGSTVTINGSHFTGATAVKFNNTSTSTFTPNGDGQITVQVPTGASTGKISVINAAGTGVSSDTFTVLALPVVSSFTPLSGIAGTTSVTINGANFTNPATVKFNGTTATTVVVNAVNKITATVPTGATTGKIAVTTAAGTGLSSTDFGVLQGPHIDSFAPAAQQAGAFVTISGSGFLGAQSVKVGSTVATFTVNSDSLITFKVPTMAPGSYQLHVTGPLGTADSASNLTVGALVKPVVGLFAPTEGPANNQNTTHVTIHGQNFTGVTSVVFGSKPATAFSLDTTNPSDNTITVDVPAGATTGKVTVTNAAGSGMSAGNFVVDPLPTIVVFTPTSGRAGITNVTIVGANMLLAGHTTTVKFGNTTVPTLTLNTANQIQATVPNGAQDGPISVTISGIGSFTTASNFIVVGTPTVSDFSPIVGKAGTVVTVNGSSFMGGSTPTVKFGTVPGGGVKVLSDTQLTVIAPGGVTLGSAVHLTVSNDAGPSDPSVGTFTFAPVPSNITFSPSHGPANTFKQTLVTINGNNFTGASSVMFGSKAATTFTVNDAGTQIQALVPVGATTGPISIATPAGSGGTAPSNFTVDPLPTITKFSANATPPAGVDPGGSFQITGTNFILTGAGAGYPESVDGLSVNGTPLTQFTGTGAVPAGQFHVDSATQISVTLPASGVSTGPVTVNSSKVGPATSPISLIVKGTPTLDSFTPASGIVGTKVTLNGSNYAGGGVTVKFNGVSAPAVTVLSSSQLTVSVPTGATTGPISVTNSRGTATSDDTFFVAIKPIIAGFEPNSGPASAQASTIVDIAGPGSGGHFNGTTAVLFNGKPSPFVSVNNDNDITAMVPVGATSGKITVVNPAGTVVSAGSFTVDAPPSVSGISPSQAGVGDTLTITGKNLIGEMGGEQFPEGTTVDFHGVFNAHIQTGANAITSTSIHVDVPDGAATGPLLVTDEWGQTAVTPLFTIVNPPSVDVFFNEVSNPAHSGRRGQPVIFIGSGFTGTPSNGVKFNGTVANSVVVADWEIIATVPKGATTGPITITNPAGTATTSDFTITP